MNMRGQLMVASNVVWQRLGMPGHHRELIRKEFLNDQLTSQKTAMIVQADVGRIS